MGALNQGLLKQTKVLLDNAFDANIGSDDIFNLIMKLDDHQHPIFYIENPNGRLFIDSAHEWDVEDPDRLVELKHTYIQYAYFSQYPEPTKLHKRYTLANLAIPDGPKNFSNFDGQWSLIEERYVHFKAVAIQVATHFFETATPPNGLIWRILDYSDYKLPLTPVALAFDENGLYKRLPEPTIDEIIKAIEKLDGISHYRVFVQTTRGKIFFHAEPQSKRVAITFYEHSSKGIVQQSRMIDENEYTNDAEVEIALSAQKSLNLKLYETVPKETAIAAIHQYFEKGSFWAKHWKINWFVKSGLGV